MDVLGIDYTFFAVSDMEKSLEFYRDTLGMPLACLVYEGKWAEFEFNPGTLALGEGEEFTKPGGGMVALAVENVKSTVEELEQAGIPIVLPLAESSACYWVVIEDPDQNRIIIHQRKDKSVG